MMRIIKEVEPISYLGRLRHVSESNMKRLASSSIIGLVLFLSGANYFFFCLPILMLLPALYNTLKYNRTYVYAIVRKGDIVILSYVDPKMKCETISFALVILRVNFIPITELLNRILSVFFRVSTERRRS